MSVPETPHRDQSARVAHSHRQLALRRCPDAVRKMGQPISIRQAVVSSVCAQSAPILRPDQRLLVSVAKARAPADKQEFPSRKMGECGLCCFRRFCYNRARKPMLQAGEPPPNPE